MDFDELAGLARANERRGKSNNKNDKWSRYSTARGPRLDPRIFEELASRDQRVLERARNAVKLVLVAGNIKDNFANICRVFGFRTQKAQKIQNAMRRHIKRRDERFTSLARHWTKKEESDARSNQTHTLKPNSSKEPIWSFFKGRIVPKDRKRAIVHELYFDIRRAFREDWRAWRHENEHVIAAHFRQRIEDGMTQSAGIGARKIPMPTPTRPEPHFVIDASTFFLVDRSSKNRWLKLMTDVGQEDTVVHFSSETAEALDEAQAFTEKARALIEREFSGQTQMHAHGSSARRASMAFVGAGGIGTGLQRKNSVSGGMHAMRTKASGAKDQKQSVDKNDSDDEDIPSPINSARSSAPNERNVPSYMRQTKQLDIRRAQHEQTRGSNTGMKSARGVAAPVRVKKEDTKPVESSSSSSDSSDSDDDGSKKAPKSARGVPGSARGKCKSFSGAVVQKNLQRRGSVANMTVTRNKASTQPVERNDSLGLGLDDDGDVITTPVSAPSQDGFGSRPSADRSSASPAFGHAPHLRGVTQSRSSTPTRLGVLARNSPLDDGRRAMSIIDDLENLIDGDEDSGARHIPLSNSHFVNSAPTMGSPYSLSQALPQVSSGGTLNRRRQISDGGSDIILVPKHQKRRIQL